MVECYQKNKGGLRLAGKKENREARITERIIDEYSKAAFCNVCDFYEISKDGTLQVKPLESIPKSSAGAISGFKQTKEGIEIKFYDKYKALEAIAKIMGIASDDSGDSAHITVNHSVPRPKSENS